MQEPRTDTGSLFIGHSENIIRTGAVELRQLDDDLDRHGTQSALIFGIERLVAVEVFADLLLRFVIIFTKVSYSREKQHISHILSMRFGIHFYIRPLLYIIIGLSEKIS